MTAQADSVLIVGPRGQIGMRAVHHWRAAGAQVMALTRKQPPAADAGLQWVTGDILKPETMEHIDFPPTFIFTPPIWFLPPLLPLLVRKGVKRIIAFSSTSIHSKKDSGRPIERDMTGWLRDGEEALYDAGRNHGIAVTILRPTLVYGLGRDINVTSIARAMRRIPVFPVPLKANGLRQPVHADDLALATLQVAHAPQTFGRAYDVAGNEQVTYREFLARIARAMGRRVLLVPVPGFAALLDIAGKLLGRPNRIHGEIARRMQQDLVFDDSDARRDFNWQPRSFLDVSRQPEGIPFF